MNAHSPSRGPGSPDIWGLHDPATGSIQYVTACPATRKAALVDVVWDFDMRACATDTRNVEAVLALVEREGLAVEWVIDTHPHADHLMANRQLAERLGAQSGIGEKVREIARLWEGFYNLPGGFDVDASFSRLFAEGDRFEIGEVAVEVWLSPGHTLGSVSYVMRDAALVHDTLMYPDCGTSRCDFPGGSAADLWDSVQRILALAEETRLFIGHDYGTATRTEPRWEASVAEHRQGNVHVRDGTVREEWIALREARDATLPLPDRMLAALQVNLRGGRLPEPEADGHAYLKLPVNRF